MSLQMMLCWPLAVAAVFFSCETRCEADESQSQAQAKSLGRVDGFADWVTSVKFTPDGKTVAAGSYDEVQLIDVESQESVAKLKVSGQAQALAFCDPRVGFSLGTDPPPGRSLPKKSRRYSSTYRTQRRRSRR